MLGMDDAGVLLHHLREVDRARRGLERAARELWALPPELFPRDVAAAALDACAELAALQEDLERAGGGSERQRTAVRRAGRGAWISG
jgi:hypothetical protein